MIRRIGRSILALALFALLPLGAAQAQNVTYPDQQVYPFPNTPLGTQLNVYVLPGHVVPSNPPGTAPFPYGTSANYPYGIPAPDGTVASPYGYGQRVQVPMNTAPVVTTQNPYAWPYMPARIGTPSTFPSTGISANPQTASELLQYYQTHPYGQR